MVNGLAWTQMGGKVLTVEAIKYQSSSQTIKVTGQLGEVMKESVEIALSWIKGHLNSINLTGVENQELNSLEKTKYLD